MNDAMFRLAPLFAIVSLLFWAGLFGFGLWVAWRWMRAHERVASHLAEIAAALRERPRL